MRAYLDLCQRIVDQGTCVENERTGKRCLTVINADLEYNVGNNEFPMITTRKSFFKSAIAEFIGYIRGYDNASDFRKLGTKTWDANANLNDAWLNNPYRKGEDDMGRVYGIQGRAWAKTGGGTVDQLQKIVDNLSQGIDEWAFASLTQVRVRGCTFFRAPVSLWSSGQIPSVRFEVRWSDHFVEGSKSG